MAKRKMSGHWTYGIFGILALIAVLFGGMFVAFLNWTTLTGQALLVGGMLALLWAVAKMMGKVRL